MGGFSQGRARPREEPRVEGLTEPLKPCSQEHLALVSTGFLLRVLPGE